MSINTKQSISDSLEVDPLLLPHIPFLLQDLWALGSSVDLIIDVLKPLNLEASQTTALDLGCGKGAVSVQLTLQFGFHVLGIDAMLPFLEDAITKARSYNVTHLCKFEQQDIHKYILDDHQFDIVIFASLGGLLGTFQETIGKVRHQVRHGGYIIIDDGYLKKGDRFHRKRYEHYRNHSETIRELTTFGDCILNEISTTELSELINKEYLQAIEKRGRELVACKPELKSFVDEYVSLQVEECQVIAEKIEGALWLIQKTS